ncbi:MAG: hypothetical protein AB7O91_00195 [Sphingomonas sp.]
MPLPRPASPRALWRDMAEFWRHRPRHQWIAALLAIAMPVGIVAAFYIDSGTNTRPRRTITVVESWPASRTDEQIKADQRRRQAEDEARAERRREQFRRIDENLNRLGI